LLLQPGVTLRVRLFLLVGALVTLLVIGQALLVRSLAGRLDRDLRTVAVSVGEEILAGFGERELPPGTTERVEQHLVIERHGPLPPGGGPAAPLLTGEQTSDELALLPGEGREIVFVRGTLPARRIEVPNAPVASTLGRFGSELLFGSLALLVVGLLATALLIHRATLPLDELAGAARRVGAGELGVEVTVRRADEIGVAVEAFNAMSARLAELDRENRRLAESEHLSELGEVARGLAHTLRNPLNALGLAVDRLAEERDPERALALAERCRRQIRRVDGSLRSFLALASAPAATPAPVELGTLAREVALEALQDAAGRVRVEVEAPSPVAITAVAAEVKAILQALVVNACEASPEGGRVVVRVRWDDEVARVEVEDEGAGVPPETMAQLFAPHVTTKPNGSGMGLYLAQRLASTRYGGDVALTPRAARGTRATLRLLGRREAA
jgi:signal transduction histidine kinase